MLNAREEVKEILRACVGRARGGRRAPTLADLGRAYDATPAAVSAALRGAKGEALMLRLAEDYATPGELAEVRYLLVLDRFPGGGAA